MILELARTRWAPRVGLGIASTLLALVLCEVGLRIVGYDPVPPSPSAQSPYRVVDDARDFVLTPGFERETGGVLHRINSLGFRGPEPTDAPAVVVIGDSIAYGLGVAWEESLPARLDERLGENLAVSGMAVPGYDTHQEVAALRVDGASLAPRWVVLQIALNDLEVATSWMEGVDEQRAFRAGVVAHSRIAQAFVAWRLASRVESHHDWVNDPDVFEDRFGDRIASLEGDEELARLMETVLERIAPSHRPPYYCGVAARVGRLRHAFEELAALAEARGFSVVALMVPSLEDVDEDYEYASHAVIEHEARRVAFDWLDVTERFVREPMVSVRLEGDDIVHPNARGHEIMAEVVAAHLAPRFE